MPQAAWTSLASHTCPPPRTRLPQLTTTRPDGPTCAPGLNPPQVPVLRSVPPPQVCYLQACVRPSLCPLGLCSPVRAAPKMTGCSMTHSSCSLALGFAAPAEPGSTSRCGPWALVRRYGPRIPTTLQSVQSGLLPGWGGGRGPWCATRRMARGASGGTCARGPARGVGGPAREWNRGR